MIQAAEWKRWVSAAVEGHPIDLGSLVGLRSLSCDLDPESIWNNIALVGFGPFFHLGGGGVGSSDVKPPSPKGCL